MDLLNNLILGLSVAVSFQNLAYAFLGCMVGTLIGVLPGIGPVATIAMLLPITFHLPPTAALIMLALGGIISVIALVTPGEITEAPKWKPITMVTIGIVCFALLFERAGLLPALVALVLIASLGGEEFKLTEVLGNMVVLAVLCILVFKIGLGMNISIITGVW